MGYKSVQCVLCADVRAVGFWLTECWTRGSVMLRSRWPGTVDTVTLDNHCQFILEVPAKPNVLLAWLLAFSNQM